jgi:hypothetical protein
MYKFDVDSEEGTAGPESLREVIMTASVMNMGSGPTGRPQTAPGGTLESTSAKTRAASRMNMRDIETKINKLQHARGGSGQGPKYEPQYVLQSAEVLDELGASLQQAQRPKTAPSKEEAIGKVPSAHFIPLFYPIHPLYIHCCSTTVHREGALLEPTL